jgi:hypothetical protein
MIPRDQLPAGAGGVVVAGFVGEVPNLDAKGRAEEQSLCVTYLDGSYDTLTRLAFVSKSSAADSEHARRLHVGTWAGFLFLLSVDSVLDRPGKRPLK